MRGDVIADDSVVVCERLNRLLTNLDGVKVGSQVADVQEAGDMVQAMRANVTILEIRMPFGSCVDLGTDIKQLAPAAAESELVRRDDGDEQRSIP